MAIRTEYQELKAERERVAKRFTAKERASFAWFGRPAPAPVDHFQWRDPFEAAPAITEPQGA